MHFPQIILHKTPDFLIRLTQMGHQFTLEGAEFFTRDMKLPNEYFVVIKIALHNAPLCWVQEPAVHVS